MSLKDETKDRGQDSNFPKFKPDQWIDLKKNDKGKVAFSWWDSSTEKRMYSTKPIEGYFLGSSMVIEAFDPKFGKNGGSYKSTPYLYKSNQVALFSPTGEVAAKCDAGELENNINNYTEGPTNAKKRKVFYIYTKGKTLAIRTNVAIGIENESTLTGNGVINDYLVKLTPMEYDPDNEKISNKCKDKWLGPLAKTNKPLHVWMQQGGVIPEDLNNDEDAIAKVKEYKAWEKHMKNNGEVEAERDGVKDSIDLLEAANQKEVDKKVDDFEPNKGFDEDEGMPF